MALAKGDPVVSGVHAAASDCHGATSEQMPTQVCLESLSRGNPDIIFPLQEFDAACDWLEHHTLIGYFVGQTPPEAMLKEWVNKCWTPHGVCLDVVQNLTKGFLLFYFANSSQAEVVFTNGPWSVCSSLLVFQKWS